MKFSVTSRVLQSPVLTLLLVEDLPYSLPRIASYSKVCTKAPNRQPNNYNIYNIKLRQTLI